MKAMTPSSRLYLSVWYLELSRFVQFALVMLLTSAGCSRAVNEAHLKDGKKKGHVVRAIVLGEVTSAPNIAPEVVVDQLSEKLTLELNSQQSSSDERDGTQPVELNVQVSEYRDRSAKRFFWGSFSGKDQIVSDLELVDSTSGEIVGGAEVRSGTSGASGSIKGLVGLHAHKIVAFLKQKFDALSLKSGMRVKVEAPQVLQKQVIGTVVSVDSSCLTLDTSSKRIVIPADKVCEVWISEERSQWLLGALWGAGAGLVVALITPSDGCSDNCVGGDLNIDEGQLALFSVPVGAIIGALVAPGERWTSLSFSAPPPGRSTTWGAVNFGVAVAF